MKPSDDFKKTIEAYIKNQAETDPLFAPCLEKEGNLLTCGMTSYCFVNPDLATNQFINL